MSTMGVILSTVGDTQYRGGIMMHMGDIMSTVGEKYFVFEYPMVLNTPTVLMVSPICIMISAPPPRYSNYEEW